MYVRGYVQKKEDARRVIKMRQEERKIIWPISRQLDHGNSIVRFCSRRTNVREHVREDGRVVCEQKLVDAEQTVFRWGTILGGIRRRV